MQNESLRAEITASVEPDRLPTVEISQVGAQRELVLGRINGRIVVEAESHHEHQLIEGYEGRSQGPWSITVYALPGDTFTVMHRGSDVGIVVTRLTQLICESIFGPKSGKVGAQLFELRTLLREYDEQKPPTWVSNSLSEAQEYEVFKLRQIAEQARALLAGQATTETEVKA